jgi:hypothetical protein
MTAFRDPDRMIRAFLEEGEEQLNDQVFDAVRAGIEQKRQRVFVGPWRTPLMNRFVTYGLGAAVVVVIGVFLGARLLASPDGGTGTGASPTPTATVEPTPVRTPKPAGLPVGSTYDLRYVGDPISINVTIPAAGWDGELGSGLLTRDTVGPPSGAGIITFVVSAQMKGAGDGLYVYGDPCQWSTTKPDTPATTVDELVAALSAQPSREASAPVDITIDGHAGKSMTLHVPADADFATCDSGQFASWGWAAEDPARMHQGPSQIDRLWIVDVDGNLVVIDAGQYAGTPQEVADGLDAIVNSVTFGS